MLNPGAGDLGKFLSLKLPRKIGATNGIFKTLHISVSLYGNHESSVGRAPSPLVISRERTSHCSEFNYPREVLQKPNGSMASVRRNSYDINSQQKGATPELLKEYKL